MTSTLASEPHDNGAAAGKPGANCDTADGCGHRQYFDQIARRYYYFDKRDGRYYWENGKPRY